MKRSLYIILFFCLVATTFGQDDTWFTDVTEDLGLRGCLGARIFSVDVNGDDYPDLLYTGKVAIRNTLELYLNLEDPENPGQRKYVRFTDESGINAPCYEGREVRWSDVAGFADFDNDGDVDLMTCTYTHRISYFTTAENGIEQGHYSEVLLNDGQGHFTILENSGMHDIIAHDGKVTMLMGADQVKTEFDYPPYFLNATGISFLDYDYDGNIDAYVSTWFTNYLTTEADARYTLFMNDILLKGNGDGTFTQVFDDAIHSVKFPMYGVNVTDYNNDGWQDVVTSAYCRSGGSIFKNMKNGSFSDASKETGYTSQLMGGDHGQALCQWEALPGDFDGDGDMDLLQVEVHGGLNAGEGGTHVSINKGKDYNYAYLWDMNLLERKVNPDYTHTGDMGGTWMDFDGDMLLDAIICQSGYEDINVAGQTRTYFNKQYPNGEFKEITGELGLMVAANRPHSAEPTDYDLDGDDDLFLSRSFDIGDGLQTYPTVWQNNVANQNYWTAVKVNAPEGCNKSAIGTRITVYTDGVSQIREIQSGLGHFGNVQPFIKNFGLEQIPAIDSMKIRFPRADLKEAVLYHPPVNAILQIGEEGLESFLFADKAEHGVIGFNMSKLDFDVINLGETLQKTFVVKNYGNAPMNITGVSIINGDPDVYTLGKKYPAFTLQPGETKEISVIYTPNAKTDFAALVRFESDAYNDEAGLFRLTGVCFYDAPVMVVNVEKLDFGLVLNDDHKDLKVTVRNYGETDLKITDASFDTEFFDHFQVMNQPIAATIASGKTHTYTLRFAPNVEYDMPIETSFSLYSNAANTDAYEIPVTCYAETRKVYMVVENENGTVEFDDAELGCTCEEPIIITTTGNKNLEISDITFRFNNPAVFAVKDYNPPYVIEPGTTSEIMLTFTPVKVGLLQRDFQIKSNNFTDDVVTLAIKAKGYFVEGVEDDLLNGDITIGLYPNPIVNEAVLNYNLASTINSNIAITVYDYLGRARKTIECPNRVAGEHTQTIDFSDLPTGAYVLHVAYNNQHTEKTIIISR